MESGRNVWEDSWCVYQEVGVGSGSGWNIWVWLAGGGCGWNLWVWLVGVVVRRYIDFLILLILTPVVSPLFSAGSLLFYLFKNIIILIYISGPASCHKCFKCFSIRVYEYCDIPQCIYINAHRANVIGSINCYVELAFARPTLYIVIYIYGKPGPLNKLESSLRS